MWDGVGNKKIETHEKTQPELRASSVAPILQHAADASHGSTISANANTDANVNVNVNVRDKGVKISNPFFASGNAVDSTRDIKVVTDDNSTENNGRQVSASGQNRGLEKVSVLNVGDAVPVQSVLRSDDDKTFVWAGKFGSIRHASFQDAWLDERGKPRDGVRLTSLFRPVHRRVAAVLGRRTVLSKSPRPEAVKLEEDASEGKRPENKTGPQGWFANYRRRRDERRRARDARDKALMGTMDIKIDRRGRLVSTSQIRHVTTKISSAFRSSEECYHI